MYIYIYVYMYVYTYIYIYIYTAYSKFGMLGPWATPPSLHAQPLPLS